MPDIFDRDLEKVEIKLSDNKMSKGDDVNITAKDPTMKKIHFGVGWDLNAFDTDALDLDISCFLLDKHGKTRKDSDFVFYNNMEGCDGAVVHNGDNRTGAGDGDDESIHVLINDLPYDVMSVVFVFSIYKGEEREQKLAKLRNSYIRLVNAENAQELLRFDLTEVVEGVEETAMIVAALNREGPKWHFKAIGEPVEGGLAKVATDYDIIVQGS